MNRRHKNKWNSQRISKRFKNRHHSNRDKRMVSKDNTHLYMKEYQHQTSKCIITDTVYDSNDITPSWSCKRCTFHNTENNSHCAICEYHFNLNTETASNNINSNDNKIIMGDYLEPILTQFESNQDDFDQQIQYAIQLSLQTPTDYDDSDDNTSISTSNSSFSLSSNSSNSSNSSKTSITKTKKRQMKKRVHTRGISFAAYWKEMTEYNAIFQKNLKYIIKENKLRMKDGSDGINTLWPNHGTISADAYDIIKRNSTLMDTVPKIDKIYKWLGVCWNARDFKIQNILSARVVERFIAHGVVNKAQLQIVYHGSRSCNDRSIIENGLLVGGTKGVAIANGSAYGRGVYCSPSLSTAGSYQRGSLFICLVRSNKCNRNYGNIWSPNIYVVQNDNDILPIYLASFSYPGGSVANNVVFKFQPAWKPLNVNIKANRDRKMKRKWSAYYKLQK